MEKTIYVKVTNDCNLKCKHCYNAQMNNSCYMSDEVLNSTIQFMKVYASEHICDEINAQLHGGEPMLYDLDKLNRLVDETTKSSNIKWSVTTNLVYQITDKHIEFFKKMLPYKETPFIITSWDYEIRFREKQEQLWEQNVKLLQSNGILVQPIICVTNPLIHNFTAKEILEKMAALGIENVNFERLTLNGRASNGELRPTNRQVDDWLYDAYVASKELNIHVPLFECIEDSVNGFLNGCRARQCMHNVKTINPDGSLSTCPNMANQTSGSISATGFIHSNTVFFCTMCAREQRKSYDCLFCKYLKYCNGDCFQLISDETGCPGLKKIYQKLIG